MQMMIDSTPQDEPLKEVLLKRYQGSVRAHREVVADIWRRHLDWAPPATLEPDPATAKDLQEQFRVDLSAIDAGYPVCLYGTEDARAWQGTAGAVLMSRADGLGSVLTTASASIGRPQVDEMVGIVVSEAGENLDAVIGHLLTTGGIFDLAPYPKGQVAALYNALIARTPLTTATLDTTAIEASLKGRLDYWLDKGGLDHLTRWQAPAGFNVSAVLDNVSTMGTAFRKLTQALAGQITDAQDGVKALQKLFAALTPPQVRTLALGEATPADWANAAALTPQEVRSIEGLSESVSDALTQADMIVGALKGLPIRDAKFKELVTFAGKAVAVGKAVAGVAAGFAVGGYIGAAVMLPAVFGAVGNLFSNSNAEQERSDQLMAAFGAMRQMLGVMDAKLDVIIDLQKANLRALGEVYQVLRSLEQLAIQAREELGEIKLDLEVIKQLGSPFSQLPGLATFKKARQEPRFGYKPGAGWPGYEARCRHFQAYGLESFFWQPRRVLYTLFSIDERADLTAFKCRSDTDCNRSALKRRYGQALELIDASVGPGKLLPYGREDFLRSFLKPERSIDALRIAAPGPRSQKTVANALLEKYSADGDGLFSWMAVAYATSALLDVFPYEDFIGAENSRLLFRHDDWLQWGGQPAPLLLLENALAIVDVAIAQLSVTAGHLMVPLIDKCLESNDPLVVSQARGILEGDFPTLRKNWVRYAVRKKAFVDDESKARYKLFTSSCNLTDLQSLLGPGLKLAARQPSAEWKAVGDTLYDPKYRAASWPHVVIKSTAAGSTPSGEVVEPLPMPIELNAGLIEELPAVVRLKQVREAVIGELAEHRFLSEPEARKRLEAAYSTALFGSVKYLIPLPLPA